MSNLGNLREFNEFYVEYFDPVEKSLQVRRKNRAEGNLSITECMEYIDKYLKRYQMTYVVNKTDPTLLFFPFMLNTPVEGDTILNSATSEVYKVVQIIKNPDTNIWDGIVKVNLVSQPKVEKSEPLVYMQKDRMVRFNHELPDAIPNPVGANLEKLLKQPPPMYPTVTWTIKKVEPGSLGLIGSSKKEWKPRLRESVKDPLVPGHTVEIHGQVFDNYVQFDCWSNDPRTSDRLVRWFEQFIRLYGKHLRREGVNNIIFWERTADDTDQTWRQTFSVRGTKYLIRTEELEASYNRDILKIDISIEKTDRLPNQNHVETRWIADQMVTGNLTSTQYKSLFYHSGQYLFGEIDIKQ